MYLKMGQFNWKVFVQVLVGLMATLVICQGFTDPRDVAAINNLYGALGTPPLIGWVQAGGDPCTEGWQGVQCVNANITAIALNGANLGGVLGESLGVFASIIQIDLGNNHIGGIIPSNLPTTTRILSLSGNQFTGTIPQTFSTLGQLTDMSLSNNHLTGVIPDTFQQLTGLINFDELLLQEDSSVVGGLESEFSKGMHLSHALGPTETLIGGNRVGGTLNTSSNMTMQRPSSQVFTYGEVAGSSSLDPQGGYMHHMTKPPHFLPHFQQNSPSRFGQQPGQQFDYGRSASVHGAELGESLPVTKNPSDGVYSGSACKVK